VTDREAVTDVPPETVEEAVGRIAEEAARLYRARDKLINMPEQRAALMHAEGCMAGLRIALCLLKGWDQQEESDKEGAADEFVLGWWQEHYPEEWGSD
jgi:hypothetical protein